MKSLARLAEALPAADDRLWAAIARVLREADEAERASRPDLRIVGHERDD